MKGRAFNEFGIGRVAEGEYIRLDGKKQFVGRIRKLTEHGLAADHDNLRRTRYAGGGTDDVLKLRPSHDGNTA